MAFAQLTYRDSLRDIEACLSAQAAKLYHMGFREPVGDDYRSCHTKFLQRSFVIVNEKRSGHA